MRCRRGPGIACRQLSCGPNTAHVQLGDPGPCVAVWTGLTTPCVPLVVASSAEIPTVNHRPVFSHGAFFLRSGTACRRHRPPDRTAIIGDPLPVAWANVSNLSALHTLSPANITPDAQESRASDCCGKHRSSEYAQDIATSHMNKVTYVDHKRYERFERFTPSQQPGAGI